MHEAVQSAGATAEQAAEPSGGSTGVAFSWGFAISLALTGIASLVGRPLGVTLTPPVAGVAIGLAALLWVQGEALRRGNRVAWRLQLGLHCLLLAYGLVVAAQTFQALQAGDLSRLPSSLLALLLTLVVSPVEIWLLLRPGSRQWYGAVEPAEALRRHSGPWLLRVLAWSVVGGLVNAIAP